MSRVSVKGAARDAIRADQKARTPAKGSAVDSFVNFAHKLGVGADNPLSTASYGFNPITRQRTLLEWIHRGSWVGGVAVDCVADDMTRSGIEFRSEMKPQDQDKIEECATALGIWDQVNETIKWGRLYGGALSVALVDGQDLKSPLRPETVGKGQFRGLLTLDRWMVEPTLEDLVTDMGPCLGLPRFYRIQSNAPALRGAVVHYSRVMVRHVGVSLPYQQRLIENLWGMSVLERLYDRLIAFDSASTGAAQLVYKSYLRTLTIEGMREIVAQGGAAMAGLTSYVDMMRRFQGLEGMTMIDAKDKFEIQGHQAFSGLADILRQLREQISGALQVPLTRLMGVSGGGLNGTNEDDLQLYYDTIHQNQVRDLHTGITTTYRMIAASEGVKVGDDFGVKFRPLRQLDETEKAETGGKVADTVVKAYESGIIGRQTALKEFRQASRTTGIFTNIDAAMIAGADDEVGPPPGELALMQHEQAAKEHDDNLDMSKQAQENAQKAAEKKDGEIPDPATGKKPRVKLDE